MTVRTLFSISMTESLYSSEHDHTSIVSINSFKLLFFH